MKIDVSQSTPLSSQHTYTPMVRIASLENTVHEVGTHSGAGAENCYKQSVA